MENYFNNLIDFAEGALPIGEEQTLLQRLASDEELRAELKKILSVKSASKDASALFAPDFALTSKVFAAAGADLIDDLAVPKLNRNNNLINYLRSKKSSLKVSLISSLLSLIMFYLLLNYFDIIEFGFTANPVFMLSSEESASFEAKPKSFNKFMENENRAGRIIRLKNLSFNQEGKLAQAHTSEDTFAQGQVLSESITEALNTKIHSVSSLENRGNPLTSYNSSQLHDLRIPIINREQSEENSIQLDFIAECKSGSLFYIKDNAENELRNPFANNFSASLMLRIVGGFYAGAELRSETFVQWKISATSSQFEQPLPYEQDFVSYTFLLRFVPENDYRLKPTGYVGCGVNSAGYILRMFSGAEYRIYNKLSLTAGIEYGNLFFFSEGRPANSQKIGLSYGLNYRF